MKKLIFMSAVAGAVLITSCKKGETGPAGAPGKDGNSGKNINTPALAKTAVTTGLIAYDAAKKGDITTISNLDLTKLTGKDLVSALDKTDALDKANALVTETTKDAEIKLAQARQNALEVLKSALPSLTAKNDKSLVKVDDKSSVKNLYEAYKKEAEAITMAAGKEVEVEAFGIFQIATVELKNKYKALLASVLCVEEETANLEETSKKVAKELKDANALKTATDIEKADAVNQAKLIRLTDAYGKLVLVDNDGISGDQKTAILNYLAAKKSLLELIKECQDIHSLSIDELGINQEIQKELGLSTVKDSKK